VGTDVAAPGAESHRPQNTFLRLVQHAEEVHRADYSELKSRMAVLGTSPSTVDLLHMQAAVHEFSMRIKLTVRVADEVGRGVQTITQRS
jgi:hypothetical protein